MDAVVRFRVGDVTLACAVTGPVDAAVVVLLHGGGADRSTWDGVAGAIAARHRVLAVDVRGFGESDRPGVYHLTAMRDDVFGLLDAAEVARAALVGHSSGGTVALLAAAHRPERVTRLVLEEAPMPKPGALRLGPLRRPDAEPPYDWAARETVVAQLNAPDPAWWAALPGITAPTLILDGGPGSHLDPALAREAAALIPDARVREIPAGHHIHRDAPAAFTGAVLPFLSQ
ncbi:MULTISPECIES: alpha/beta fold hydrolase [Catenuloplanes]|uniref:Pimeloyl-ACP methyl ester carboxylesterase n=1 Tax=Catenuloplanes niger TaxID=587534 RepID=A0AAE4CZI1_9ACTN|nr:alpha/beta fold hydrolase [Catenuloplanes niger]MDR7326909.1 pimeloyl-ACP methyl ester carboxylesterase [Catenuloplanes niger]